MLLKLTLLFLLSFINIFLLFSFSSINFFSLSFWFILSSFIFFNNSSFSFFFFNFSNSKFSFSFCFQKFSISLSLFLIFFKPILLFLLELTEVFLFLFLSTSFEFTDTFFLAFFLLLYPTILCLKKLLIFIATLSGLLSTLLIGSSKSSKISPKSYAIFVS